MFKHARWIIFIPIAVAIFAKPAKADVLGDWTASQSCASASIEMIDDSIILHGPDGGCPGANWIKIETTVPEGVNTVDFTWEYQTNDGWVYDPPQYGVNGVYTLLTQQNNASGSRSVPVEEGDIFSFRQYSIDTCCQPGHLTISNLSLWEFTTTSTTSTTTTTTTVPETTVPATVLTTTTVPETSTSSTSTTTSTTVDLPDTSTSSSSLPQTTSSVLVPTTTVPPETSTPTPPQIVQPEPVEPSVPEEIVEVPTGTTTTVVEEPIQEETPPEETTTTTEPSPEETYPDTTEETVDSTIAPDLEPNLEPDTPLTDEQVTSIIEEAESVEALVEALSELEPEQVAQVLEEILSEEPTQEQAAALATSPEVLAIVSAEQAGEIFAALDVDELTDEQTEQLVEAVQNAPEAVREEFEDKVDVFKSGLDTYVPIGSTIPVGTRRTLIAATAGITLAAAGTRIRR
jgi:hypothetical protein